MTINYVLVQIGLPAVLAQRLTTAHPDVLCEMLAALTA
jgi:hypothetical protein